MGANERRDILRKAILQKTIEAKEQELARKDEGVQPRKIFDKEQDPSGFALKEELETPFDFSSPTNIIKSALKPGVTTLKLVDFAVNRGLSGLSNVEIKNNQSHARFRKAVEDGTIDEAVKVQSFEEFMDNNTVSLTEQVKAFIDGVSGKEIRRLEDVLIDLDRPEGEAKFMGRAAEFGALVGTSELMLGKAFKLAKAAKEANKIPKDIEALQRFKPLVKDIATNLDDMKVMASSGINTITSKLNANKVSSSVMGEVRNIYGKIPSTVKTKAGNLVSGLSNKVNKFGETVIEKSIGILDKTGKPLVKSITKNAEPLTFAQLRKLKTELGNYVFSGRLKKEQFLAAKKTYSRLNSLLSREAQRMGVSADDINKANKAMSQFYDVSNDVGKIIYKSGADATKLTFDKLRGSIRSENALEALRKYSDLQVRYLGKAQNVVREVSRISRGIKVKEAISNAILGLPATITRAAAVGGAVTIGARTGIGNLLK